MSQRRGPDATRRVLIVQEYVPQYRTQFFTKLRERAWRSGIHVDLIFSHSDTQKASRLIHKPPDFAVSRKQFRLRWRSRDVVTFQNVVRLLPSYELVIVEQANRHLVTWWALITQRLRGRRMVALWGHGFDHQGAKSGFRERLKSTMLVLPDWWFAYTDEIADHVVARGFPPARVTSVHNTVDTDELRAQLEAVKGVPRAPFQALYLGGLFTGKRIEYLLEAADLIARSLPEFRLVIAGDGELVSLVQIASSTRPWLHYAGPVVGEERALLLAQSTVILMPGLVGLVAVDSLVSGLPIVTINHAHHSPEFAYLTRHNSLVLPDQASPRQYADAVAELLAEPGRVESMRRQCLEDSGPFNLDEMVDAFFAGIEGALAAGRRRRSA